MRVAAIGDNCIDLYPKLERFYATGNAVDFAVHMQRLGINTSVVSTTGNDEYGKVMIDTLKKEGIDLSHFHVGGGPTAISYMDMVGTERTYGDYIEGVMEKVIFTEEDVDFAASHDLVHTAFWGNADKHLEKIHNSGALISFDYATELEDPLVQRTLPFVDYAFFSYKERDSYIEEYLKQAAAKGVKIAVATFGEKGSLAFDGKSFYEFGTFKAEVVNTIGAGDSFIAGFMNGILKGWDIVDCLEQGAKVASEVVGVFGPWKEK